MFGKKSAMKRFLLSITFCFSLFSCTEDKLNWIALGDSITYLNDHPEETGNRITKGYLTLVSEALPHINYINKGYNGWTAQRISQAIDTLGLEAADIYSVFLGTNDWWRGVAIGTFADYENNTGSETFYGSYRIILDKFRSLNSEAKIILITPMQRGDFVYIAKMTNNAYGSYREKESQNLAEFAEAIVNIGKHEKLDVVDLYNQSGMTLENMVKYKRVKDPADSTYKNLTYPAYINIPFNPETDEYPYPVDAIGTTYDGLHPSDSGYQIIAKMLIDVLEKDSR
jgi:lysophospholipase L1-like esterase